MRKLPAVAAILAAVLTAGCEAPEPDSFVRPVTPSAQPTSAAPPTTLTVVAAGDLLVHPALSEQAA
ncbi:hypothetical protein ACFQZ8_30740, partial [Micromonospora azadirachtae]